MDFRILIVDDEYPIREWLTYLLKENRPYFYVDSAENGQKALEKLAKSGFDLVITDIRMPLMDGVELLKNISDYFPKTGTIVLSSYDDYNYVRSTFKYDATDYLLKTEIDSGKFLDCVDSFFHGKNMDENAGLYIHEIRELVKDETPNSSRFLSLLSSYAEYQPTDSFFCVLLKFYNEEENPKPYYPAVSETSFIFNLPFTETICIGCIELASNPSLLSTLQLQSVYLKQLQKYNNLSLLLYTDILSKQSDLLKEIQKLYIYRKLDFYNIHSCNSTFLSVDQNIKIKELYLSVRKTLLSSDSHTILTETENFMNCVKNHLYPDIEDLKFMCSKIYESAYFASHISDFAEYTQQIPQISSDILHATSWDNLKNIFTQSLASIYRHSFGSTANLSYRIAKAISIIENHYMESLTLGSIADDLHVNPEYFSRSFKKEVGTNFNAYLNNVRLQKALILLRNPQILISEIAIETGFQNPAYFSKCFKASFGISPQEWRNQNN